MNRKLASILAIALCLSSCGTAETSTPSQAETTTTAASEVESQQYEDLTIDDIIFPGELKAEIKHKSTGCYAISIDGKWDLMLVQRSKDGDILWETEEDDARLDFLLMVSAEDYDTLKKTYVDTTKSDVNGYTVYVFKYNGKTCYTACRMLGDSKYMLSVDDTIYDIPSEEEFNLVIEKLKIAP